ncbi:PREDICTED: LEAF RUST 10 DISEASE-RESISTANCE LOCUS RECEPTOR-LIKE PROTEIN KINASE-like 1.2 isoform X2 [Nicotiana attenuata]|uniref:non-specific serine/threonine protein kinase n=1 Tax=Nicotiana attenuata TaxID=49451 RepID=A0A314KKP9_NICAT|nr:PREDICTED: LEAF RUST 10 DISEASE-RESISTANCE LOCUS RECEPTOR-LIKE PROTEIN KINASE-like 1.2 isoform X2 [Nicotiana attenuata]OIT29314.1 leaf rust 10 disease-resistance locus receptor-like protein kinase-like 1.2 [Nicotiana attenuata]
MNLQCLFMVKKSVSFLVIAILFINLADDTLSIHLNSSACITHSCGNGVKISYPFWIPEKQPPYCGLPAYNVTCNKDKSLLHISGDEFIIKEVFYTNNSILLAKADVFDKDNKCPVPTHNFSLSGTPFRSGPNTADLFFFYDCTQPYERETYAVNCASNATHHSFAVFHTELLEHSNYSVESCQDPVYALVETDSLDRLLKMNYMQVLQKGFFLQWDGTNCRDCQSSGGHCGVQNNEFICICKDQPQQRTCLHGRNKIGLKVGIGVGAAAITALMAGVIFFIYRCRQKKIYAGSSLFTTSILSYPSSIKDPEKATSLIGVHLFDYNELDEATNNFDSKKELGDGGYGTVYKGKLRDGRVVAVKRLYENNCKRVEQFMNEIDILTRLHHPNLVTLYGCTSRHSRELLLVYEYIPNGTVADHLHGVHSKPGSLSWNTRMKISLETASALAYLHASDVIHRDVKTNNILLDNNFCVKVADFGLSRLFPTDVTHVSTAPQGTPGYVDPEYHECYQLTDKSDVYSFGVVLIELISSLPAVDIFRHRHEINLSNMAINKIQGNALHELVDSNLGFDTDDKVRSMITTVAELAFQCLQSDRELRPSMQEVVEALMRIQRINKTTGKTDKECPDDDTGLLNSITLSVSPDSVTTKWSSSPTTPNAST